MLVVGNEPKPDAVILHEPVDQFSRDLCQAAREVLGLMRSALPQQIGGHPISVVFDTSLPLLARAGGRNGAGRECGVSSCAVEFLEDNNRTSRVCHSQCGSQAPSTRTDDDHVNVDGAIHVSICWLLIRHFDIPLV